MEITKREILFSTIIIAVMIGLGVCISNPIITSVTDKALKTISAVQVKDSSAFDYIRRTNVGDFLAESTLYAAEPVSISDIEGTYAKIEKIKEEYRMHTRVVTTTDSKGNTHSHTETYWTWDRVDSWEWESPTVKFLGVTFTPKAIHYRYKTTYKETIKPKVGFFVTKVRYKYYTAPKEDYGVLSGNINNKSYTNLNFNSKQNIRTVIENAQNNINSAPVIFWILWVLFTIGLVFLFYYAENKWLYDKREHIDTRHQDFPREGRY